MATKIIINYRNQGVTKIHTPKTPADVMCSGTDKFVEELVDGHEAY